MRKLVVIICLVSVSFLLTGCVTQNSGTAEPFKNISLESNVVELAYANITTHWNKDFDEEDLPILVVKKVDVNYLFHNIAGRIVNVSVTVEYYDENNNLLHIGGPKTINNLPKDYIEKNIAAPNTISYDGIHVADVDHVKIMAVEV
ncbi:MAG: hypothetical protein JXA91_00045 [Candidatus Thermoplasmatota archaeon]|nr:hypothetical protein [Candidatus Thermoplasmatota archaeon]